MARQGHVLLRPLIRDGEMASQWKFVKEQQELSDGMHLRKVRDEVAASAEYQTLLAQLPLTPRSPSARARVPPATGPRAGPAAPLACGEAAADDGGGNDGGGDYDDDEGFPLERADSAPPAGRSGSDSMLAAKMGVGEAEVATASRDTMIEHIFQLTDIFAIPKALAIPTPPADHARVTVVAAASTPPSMQASPAKSIGDDDGAYTLQRGKSVPNPRTPAAPEPSQTSEQELARMREAWSSSFFGRVRSDGSESDPPADDDDEFTLQVQIDKTFLTLAVRPSTTVHEVKAAVEAQLGPRAAEQVLLLYAQDDVDRMSPVTLEAEQALSAAGVQSRSTLVCRSIHDAKVTGVDGGNRGFSRRTEVMMRRNKVMEAVLRGWRSVDPGATPTTVQARLDPNRTSEAAFSSFVQDQHTLIRHARSRLGLPTTDQMLEQMIAHHAAEVEQERATEAMPSEGIPDPRVSAVAPGPSPGSEPEPRVSVPVAEVAPEPEPEPEAACDEIEVVFRVMAKGVPPFSHRFPARATTAQVHAYLTATMAESGMVGEYELKETGFPPRRLTPSDTTTLAAAGLATEPKLTLQVAAVAASTSANIAPPGHQAAAAAARAEPADELSPGGTIYEAVKGKYVGQRGGGRLEPGHSYRAPLVRGRVFRYDAAADRLVDAPAPVDDPTRRPPSAEGGMAAVWREMFAGEEVSAQLRRGGSYYTNAARSLGVPATGPLNPRLLYTFPNPLMQYAAGGGGDGSPESEYTLHFTYDAAADELVYSHAGAAGADDAEEGGQPLSRSSSAELRRQALRSWHRGDFLRAACLRPGGLLYMNAVDSFGTLTADKLYLFPHFGPIQADHFRYQVDTDSLVLDGAEQSDFIQRSTISSGMSGSPRMGSLATHGDSVTGSGGGGETSLYTCLLP